MRVGSTTPSVGPTGEVEPVFGVWYAYIYANNTEISLGTFETKELAMHAVETVLPLYHTSS